MDTYSSKHGKRDTVNGNWNTVHKRAKRDGTGKVYSILPVSAKNREFLASDTESREF